MAEFVKSLHPSIAARIVRIDSDVDQSEMLQEITNPIIIGTQKALPIVDWATLMHVVYLDIDNTLAVPEVMAGEKLWHTLAQMRYKLNPSASLIIETKSPDHTLLQSLQDQSSFYKHELELRHALKYPPYCFSVRYLFGDRSKEKALSIAKKQHAALMQALTNRSSAITISDPYQILPLRYKGMSWYAILARIPHENWMNDLLMLNAHVGARWQIDPHPQTIIGYA